jgi:hypothetical protein
MNPTGRAPLKERKDDLYQTHPAAVEALELVEALPRLIWEPACGPGSIVRALRGSGHEVIDSDLVDYGQKRHGWDFLLEQRAPDACQCIVTNPPFKLANQFAAHALKLCPRVYLLLRLAFLESEGRTDLLESGYLHRVYVFRNRLPMMHREDYAGPRVENGMLAFAWFCWDRSYKAATVLERVSWQSATVTEDVA